MKTIGTDVNLKTCKAEGYLMMQFGNAENFKPDTQYRVFAYLPAFIDSDKKRKPVIDTTVSWNELVEIYNKNKGRIDSFADDMPQVMAEPGIYNLLNAACTINSYCGLP